MKTLVILLLIGFLLVVLVAAGDLSFQVGQNSGSSISELIVANRESEANLIAAGKNVSPATIVVVAALIAFLCTVLFALAFAQVGGLRGLSSVIRQIKTRRKTVEKVKTSSEKLDWL